MSVPMIFKSLEMRNFLSFGNVIQTIELDGQGTVTVTGENLDQGGSNGSGKCLFYDTLINIRNKKTGEIKSIKIGEFYDNAGKMEKNPG